MKNPRLGQVRYRKRRAGDGQDNHVHMLFVVECFYDGAWQYIGPAGPKEADAIRSAAVIRACVDGVLGDILYAFAAEATQ